MRQDQLNSSEKLIRYLINKHILLQDKKKLAWTVPIGTTAQKAAGVIHSDFEKGFIRAEVISYKDYEQYKSEAKVREAGKIRVEGKEYLVQDGDVMHFRFNV